MLALAGALREAVPRRARTFGPACGRCRSHNRWGAAPPAPLRMAGPHGGRGTGVVGGRRRRDRGRCDQQLDRRASEPSPTPRPPTRGDSLNSRDYAPRLRPTPPSTGRHFAGGPGRRRRDRCRWAPQRSDHTARRRRHAGGSHRRYPPPRRCSRWHDRARPAAGSPPGTSSRSRCPPSAAPTYSRPSPTSAAAQVRGLVGLSGVTPPRAGVPLPPGRPPPFACW